MEKLKFRLPGFWVTILLTVVVLLGACARPPSTTVREGGDPFHVDKDVAFRTTYYFRVFDYCVEKKIKSGKFSEVIVPLSDSLYRFRMTGKSATLFSNIKFESGILKAWEIDPFGAKVGFDPNTNRFRVISPQEADADARRAAIKRDLQDMLQLYDKLKESVGKEVIKLDDFTQKGKTLTLDVLGKMISAIKRKIDELSSISSGPTDDGLAVGQSGADTPLSREQKSAILKEAVRKVITLVFKDVEQKQIQAILNAGYDDATLLNADPSRPGFVERALLSILNKAAQNSKLVDKTKEILAPMLGNGKSVDITQIQMRFPKLSIALKIFESDVLAKFARGQPPPSIHCPEDAPVRRGFQVLGPEGWRTFDPDERLILAMSSSAAPLVSTLKDLSNRVLNARDNPAAELLPIAQEQKRLAQAERELDRQRGTEKAPEKLAEAICKTLVENESKKTEICGE